MRTYEIACHLRSSNKTRDNKRRGLEGWILESCVTLDVVICKKDYCSLVSEVILTWVLFLWWNLYLWQLGVTGFPMGGHRVFKGIHHVFSPFVKNYSNRDHWFSLYQPTLSWEDFPPDFGTWPQGFVPASPQMMWGQRLMLGNESWRFSSSQQCWGQSRSLCMDICLRTLTFMPRALLQCGDTEAYPSWHWATAGYILDKFWIFNMIYAKVN